MKPERPAGAPQSGVRTGPNGARRPYVQCCSAPRPANALVERAERNRNLFQPLQRSKFSGGALPSSFCQYRRARIQLRMRRDGDDGEPGIFWAIAPEDAVGPGRAVSHVRLEYLRGGIVGAVDRAAFVSLEAEVARVCLNQLKFPASCRRRDLVMDRSDDKPTPCRVRFRATPAARPCSVA